MMWAAYCVVFLVILYLVADHSVCRRRWEAKEEKYIAELAAARQRCTDLNGRMSQMVDLDLVGDRDLITILDRRLDGLVLCGLKYHKAAPPGTGLRLDCTTVSCFELPTDPEMSTYLCRQLWAHHNQIHGRKPGPDQSGQGAKA